ncbi:MAG: glycogen debranching enzyme family protein [Anaerolineales bacterium]|nr:glycogen debranching enzyme family protein [Anaerolineales bacterium]
MLLDFGREVGGNLAVAEKREWLVTNGIGGFASGTIANMLTRRYHGLLMAALQPPLGRTLLLAKLDETAEYDGIYPRSGHYYPLFVNRWSNDIEIVEPNGNDHINRFHLEGTTPVWTFACGNALLEKRIWMQPGANSTYIQYQLTRATGPMLLQAKAFANYRDYHQTTMINNWQPEIYPVERGIRLRMFDGAVPFYLFSDRAELEPQFEWYEDFLLAQEEYRGQNDIADDHIYAAHMRVVLQPGESVTLLATTERDANLDGHAAYAERQAYEAQLLARVKSLHAVALTKPLKQLVLAADQFIVKRPTATDTNGRSIIAGYPWFGDWGRDTMIALPGLTLSTGRPEVAATVLRTFAQFVDQGMLPNRFPDQGEVPEYNTVDATLWYFEAIRQYYDATSDNELVRELYPILADIIAWHIKGTRYNIHMDNDGLIYAGEEGVQLTWMDAKVDGWVVTPRIGKPVEVNALWYNALCIMVDFATQFGFDTDPYLELVEKVQVGYGRYWNAEMGYCFDVLDCPDDDDDLSLRPNQIFAVSLQYSPLTPEQQRSVVDACSRLLVTAHGLRSLSPQDSAYIGHYGGDQLTRDEAYHQGTVWSWLIGPFVRAHLRVYGDLKQARTYLTPLIQHLTDHGVGSISEIFDGDPPFTPRGCTAQAWSVAEVLRAWQMTELHD